MTYFIYFLKAHKPENNYPMRAIVKNLKKLKSLVMKYNNKKNNKTNHENNTES